MPRGATESPYSLEERKDMAHSMFIRGYSNSHIAQELMVSLDTVGRYRAAYEAELEEQAHNNPQLLTDYLANTVRALAELDEVRQEAWSEYEESTQNQHRSQMLSLILRTQDQRAKLFGLFGVKAEFFAHVQTVRTIQTKLLQFLQSELCEEDLARLEEFLTSDEIQQYFRAAGELPQVAGEESIIDVETVRSAASS